MDVSKLIVRRIVSTDGAELSSDDIDEIRVVFNEYKDLFATVKKQEIPTTNAA